MCMIYLHIDALFPVAISCVSEIECVCIQQKQKSLPRINGKSFFELKRCLLINSLRLFPG